MLNKGAVPSTELKPEQKEFRPATCWQILRCFLNKPTELKKNRQDSKEAGHGSTSVKWKEKINNKLSSHEPIELLQKRKYLPVQSYQKVFYPKA